jgi:hypothetical protein
MIFSGNRCTLFPDHALEKSKAQIDAVSCRADQSDGEHDATEDDIGAERLNVDPGSDRLNVDPVSQGLNYC